MALGTSINGNGEANPSQVAKVLDSITGKTQRNTLALVEDYLKSAKEQRMHFERQWYVNLAFYFGRHYVEWLGTSGVQNLNGFQRLHEPAAPPWRVRLVINRVRSIARKEMSKLTKEKPQGYVIPASTEDQDRLAATAASALVEYLFSQKKLNRVLRRMVFWQSTCGTGFIKDWFDSNMLDENGQPGEICIEAVPPLQLFVPNLQEVELENQPWVCHSMGKDPDWIERVYNKRVEPDSYAGGDVTEQKFQSVMGLYQPNKTHVTVSEMYLKPCKPFPSGAKITWAKDTLLNIEEEFNIYGYDEYPFTKFDSIPSGRFYGDSTINDLLPLQRELNRTRSQIIEAKNRMSKPQLVAARGSVDPNKITSEPGLIVFYTPGFEPPQPIPLVSLPNYVIEEVERCKQDMEEISANRELPRGGVTAASAIGFLQEEDDSTIAPAISSVEEGVERIGQHFLQHVVKFWTKERQIKVVGTNKEIETFALAGSNIKGNTDFRVEAGSATPRSRAAKQAFITELGKMGWIKPQQALNFLDMSETARLYEEAQIDARQAQRENMRIASGMGADMMESTDEMGMPVNLPVGVPINEYDNHTIHIVEHMNFQKKQQYELLEPITKAVFEQHVMHHRQMLQAELMGVLPPKPQDPFVGAPIPPMPSVGGMGGGMGGPPDQQPAPVGSGGSDSGGGDAVAT